jgi:Glycosyltransferase Family 4
MSVRRILHCARFFYCDSSNGAAAANRAMMECLAHQGFEVDVRCGSVVDVGYDRDPADLLASCGYDYEEDAEGDRRLMVGPAGLVASYPARMRTKVNCVPVTIYGRPTHRCADPELAEFREFLFLAEAELDRFRPEVMVTYGGDALTLEILARARRRGIATVFTLHNFAYSSPATFVDADAVIVGSQFTAEYYRREVGIECVMLPNLVAPGKVRAEDRRPDYLVYVNPCMEKGVYAFARIAEELGRRRPDIPLLVVESRGTEATLVSPKTGVIYRGPGSAAREKLENPRGSWKNAG